MKGAHWCGLGVYRYGRTEQEAEPTIVVTTPDKRKSDLINLGKQARKVCAENEAPDLKMVVVLGSNMDVKWLRGALGTSGCCINSG